MLTGAHWHYRTFWSNGEVPYLDLEWWWHVDVCKTPSRRPLSVLDALYSIHRVLYPSRTSRKKTKYKKERVSPSEGKGESVAQANLFISLFIQAPCRSCRPRPSSARPLSCALLAWLSSAAMQLGENNVCGPDATAEVTRRKGGGAREQRQQTPGRARASPAKPPQARPAAQGKRSPEQRSPSLAGEGELGTPLWSTLLPLRSDTGQDVFKHK